MTATLTDHLIKALNTMSFYCPSNPLDVEEKKEMAEKEQFNRLKIKSISPQCKRQMIPSISQDLSLASLYLLVASLSNSVLVLRGNLKIHRQFLF